MDDDKQNDDATAAGGSRKRTPPTIDLTANVSGNSGAANEANSSASPSGTKTRKSWRERFRAARAAMTPSFRWRSSSAIKTPKPARGAFTSMFVAGLVGAVVAVLALGGIWFATSSGGSGRILSRLPTSTAKSDLETPGKRTKADQRASAASIPDTATSARLDALEKSVASLRDDIESVRAALDELKAAPAPQADTSAIDERMSKIERATIALTGEVGSTQKSSDDPRLRRIAVAATLDAAVNRGEPYAVALTAAKSSAEDASILKPLDEFADKGLPSASTLNRELIGLLPQILPKQSSSPPSGLLDRIAQSASKTLRIRRVDDDEAANIAAKAESAARRDDLATARREVEQLSGWGRAPVASWIEKVDAREAALAASRQFAASAAAALPKSVQ